MIVVVRHGQDQDNAQGILNGHRDLALTEVGQAQMRLVATQLQQMQIDVIVTSPLRRAITSAQIIADYLNNPQTVINPKLIERDFGCLTGKLIAEIPYYASAILAVDGVNYFLDASGAESFPNLLKRARQVLSDLQVTYPSQNLLLVTHGDMAKMLRSAYYGWDWEEGLRTPYLSNAGLLYLHNAKSATLACQPSKSENSLI
ncbi:histidine phosphatase family protein [Nostoc sp. LEGE 12447]|uniref:histidine phosphatase family protein n=1 Tax=Nostoc sp. LEGE 12447 TaxID=1828640 RepID=UPI001883968D|nr:histidine phosphatase family protein [Nostoc sp. LEGE 12447]MBE9003394.1 histidine phosphatase family protein [Nostoc sp. LEGE 12447]